MEPKKKKKLKVVKSKAEAVRTIAACLSATVNVVTLLIVVLKVGHW